jgi:uncharacterized pyridoxal phosphate-dependent enzyme
MDVYDDLGIKPFINAYRPLTRLGGATMPDRVVQAMREASRRNVDLRAMQQKVGSAIASLTRNDAAYVSCGAASGITLAVAACMAGTNPVLSERLPQTEGMKNEVIMHKCDRGFKCDVAIRCAGAYIVHIGDGAGATENDLRSAISEQTSAIFSVAPDHPGKLPLERMIVVAREYDIPVLVDAAFLVPPRENLWRFTRDSGADAVFFSGGKGLRGPQCTGLVLGKTWIVKACAFHGVPNDRIGRGMKVGKEELAGIYAAVKLFMEQDEASLLARRLEQLEYILASIKDIPDVHVRRLAGIKAEIAFGRTAYDLTPASACRWLLNSVPSVYLEPSTDGVIVSTECIDDGNEIIVANQLIKLFKAMPSFRLRSLALSTGGSS